MTSKRPFYYEYAWAYDLLVDANTEKRVNFIKEIISSNSLEPPVNILDAGCGSGRMSMALASEGYNVTGIDLSEIFINEATNRNEFTNNLFFEVGNLLDIDFSNTFDLIICRGVLNDIIGNDEREKLFKRIYKALKYNGIFIADVREWEETKKIKTSFPIHEKKVETELGLLTFVSETSLNGSDKTLKIKESHCLEKNGENVFSYNSFTMKCWTLHEIIQHCKSNKFSVEKLLSDFDANAKIGLSDRIIFVLKKCND